MTYRHPAPEQKARYVRAKFDEIAAYYDRFNDLITQGQHRLWKRELVRRLGLAPRQRGLDLCCGTGDIAARLLRGLGESGTLVAADFSRAMLGIARRRLAAAAGEGRGARCLVMAGDAMRLPFREASFDFVTIGYGLRNVTDLSACLAEVHRVLVPDGVLASLDVGRVRNRLLRPLASFYLFRVVPLIGRVLQPGQEMYQYLPSSTVDYPSQDALKGLLEAGGFERVEIVEYVFGASVIHVARKAAAL